MDDETIRALVLWAFAFALVALFVGGSIYKVAGAWSDGARTITLKQWGPYVWGRCYFETGYQRFSGRMVFGHLKLSRRDYGDDHLRSLGFSNDHLAAMQGAATGFFKLRLEADGQLRGHFYGRTFSTRQDKMVPTSVAQAQPRTWQRSLAYGT